MERTSKPSEPAWQLPRASPAPPHRLWASLPKLRVLMARGSYRKNCFIHVTLWSCVRVHVSTVPTGLLAELDEFTAACAVGSFLGGVLRSPLALAGSDRESESECASDLLLAGARS